MEYVINKSLDGLTKISFRERYHSVIIPTKDDKNALCISCQIGCPVGCKFCFSGKSFKRNLKPEEIINQFSVAKEILGKNPTTIIFMGMGEPALNLKSVEEAANYFHSQGMAYNHITISTSCIKNLNKLAELPYGIAISLHSPYDSMRKKIVNSPIKIKQILEFSKKCFEKRKKRAVMIEYSLIKNLNDRDKDLKKLISIKWPKKIMFNIIEFNESKKFKQADKEKFLKFKKEIIRTGWKCFIRQSRGKDIEAACGMLS